MQTNTHGLNFATCVQTWAISVHMVRCAMRLRNKNCLALRTFPIILLRIWHFVFPIVMALPVPIIIDLAMPLLIAFPT